MSTDEPRLPHHGIQHTLLRKVVTNDRGLPIAPAFIVRLHWTDAVFFRGPFTTRERVQAWADENEPRINTAQPRQARLS